MKLGDSAQVGWLLAMLALMLGWWQYGWRGALLAVSMIVFWFLLQFSRMLRLMRQAAQRPVGVVDSAVMLQARLQPGMTLSQIIPLTLSLGRRVPNQGTDDADLEHWRWADRGGAALTVELRGGRLASWQLTHGDTDGAGTPAS